LSEYLSKIFTWDSFERMSDNPIPETEECPASSVQEESEATQEQEESVATPEPEESAASPSKAQSDEESDNLPITPEKDEALLEETITKAEKTVCAQAKDGLVTTKPKIGPRSKVKNGGDPEIVPSPNEIKIDSITESSATPLVASEPKKHRPGPKSKRSDMSGSDSLNMDESVIKDEPSEPKKHKPGPKSKQVEENIEQPRSRPGPKSKTRPASTSSSPPPTPVVKRPGPKSKTQPIQVATDSPKKKLGPKSKTVKEPLTFENADHSRESQETIKIKISPSKKTSLKDKSHKSSSLKLHSQTASASMKSFIDDSGGSSYKTKRKRSFKTSGINLPVDSNYPILQDGSTERSKCYKLPHEWKKEFSQRQGGVSGGKWDAYLHPPPQFKHKKIRSLPDLFSFIKQYPECPIDPVFVNMDGGPSAVEGQVDSKLSIGACKVYEFLQRIRAGEDVDDFYTPAKKAKMGTKSDKSSPHGEQSLVAKKIKGVPAEVETELLRHASSEMPSKKEMKRMAKETDLSYKLVKKWFTNYFKFKERLTTSSFFLKEEHLPDFSDDSGDLFDEDPSQSDMEAAVMFTPDKSFLSA